MIKNHKSSSILVAKVRIDIGGRRMAAKRRRPVRGVALCFADIQSHVLEQQHLSLNNVVWVYPVCCLAALVAQGHRVQCEIKVYVIAFFEDSRYARGRRLPSNAGGIGCCCAIGVESRTKCIKGLDKLIQQVAKVQLKKAVRAAADLMFEDMRKLSVLGPALILFQDLDEAGALGDLEAGQ